MRGLSPKLLAAALQPFVQSFQAGEARDGLPEPVTRILDVLLNLPLLPTGCRIAEVGLEEVERFQAKWTPVRRSESA
jgi:hypothetical protein